MTQIYGRCLVLCVLSLSASAFQAPFRTTATRDTSIRMVLETDEKKEKGYVPKWTKKLTLAEQTALENGGNVDYKDVGLIGNVPVVFKEGKETKTTMALVGQPLSDVATQAGQFIKYGCKKGECGTCEALCNGQWVRPCMATVPADLTPGQDLVIQVKEIKKKSKSSGKFFSVKSFFMGFYNNLIGMVGFVTTRRAAKKNYQERMEYEDLIAQKTAAKKAARAAAQKQELKP
mmetsp:Transcript_14635/g.21620  ORF Transcript_14635/g.21620 Transcript_14635/m.21620 type:complete len:232 (-) Transcript_14635:84-779(-)|eukprot:CAMPEP_0195528938 /NCGR_PEP_ID=MMETSP0794_2-20130614/31299_1 /TAXON_ID=515487 /ORGANISM="Stephanopyxis turris, Strain CCMP 815" /LENGTH=231 /DNA_ID=CAMNT_0040660157 /DNA_START=137 /DNA_END=832 /DNA_ORIENTATION=+